MKTEREIELEKIVSELTLKLAEQQAVMIGVVNTFADKSINIFDKATTVIKGIESFLTSGTSPELNKLLSKAREEGRKEAVPEWISVNNRLPLEKDGTVAVMMNDGSILTAWATYWHGASNDFAQWTFPFDVDDAQVTHWATLPASLNAKEKEE